MISCFINREGQVSTQKTPGTVEFEFNFDLSTRQVMGPDQPRYLSSDWHLLSEIVLIDFYLKVGTPETLMSFAAEGHLSKLELAELLSPEKRKLYLDTCARFEKAITEACTAKNDPCLESGCALEGETCLNAILEAGDIYTTAYVSMWTALFINPDNRISVWRN